MILSSQRTTCLLMLTQKWAVGITRYPSIGDGWRRADFRIGPVLIGIIKALE